MGGCVGGERMVEEEGFGNSGGGGGGLCLLGGASRADPRRFLKMGSSKVPRSEKASEDTSQWRLSNSGGNLCLCW